MALLPIYFRALFRLSQYCGDKFSVEPVDVTYDDKSGDVKTTPLLSTRTEKASVAEICSIIGVEVRVLFHR